MSLIFTVIALVLSIAAIFALAIGKPKLTNVLMIAAILLFIIATLCP